MAWRESRVLKRRTRWLLMPVAMGVLTLGLLLGNAEVSSSTDAAFGLALAVWLLAPSAALLAVMVWLGGSSRPAWVVLMVGSTVLSTAARGCRRLGDRCGSGQRGDAVVALPTGVALDRHRRPGGNGQCGRRRASAPAASLWQCLTLPLNGPSPTTGRSSWAPANVDRRGPIERRKPDGYRKYP